MIHINNTGLVLVDVQGKLARMVYESDDRIARMATLIKGCQTLGLPIIWLEQYPKGLSSTIPELSKLLQHQKPIEKHHFNALEEKEVVHAISESTKQNWLVCGIEAHICVYQTAMGLVEKNYHVEVVTDCISSRQKESIDVAKNKFTQSNIAMTNVEMCLYELMKSANYPRFKEILRLIK